MRGGDKEQVLQDHLYNTDEKGAWRREVDIEIVREVQEKPGDGGAYDCASLPVDCVTMEDGSDDDASDTDISKSQSKNESKGEGASKD